MLRPSYGDEAPIAAFATPLAESALAVIRCSGGNAAGPAGERSVLNLAAAVFSRPRALLASPGGTVVHGWIIRPDTASAGPEKIDEVLVSVYRAPKSYTGEDGLDISCHGGIAAARAVMASLKSAGFREALPGEFTFRAFINGKLDLTRSESVMELVSAKTEQGRRRAVNRLSGALEAEIEGVKGTLTGVLAESELYLDYSEDEIGEAPLAEAAGTLPGRVQAEGALARLKALAASYRRERLYQEGALAVIAGRPNAGKSSLFNRLAGEDRSIVTDIPGTTRDWIEAWISLEGIPLRLVDTAGLRGPAGTRADPVEQIGMERSRELLAGADLVLYLIDGKTGITGEDRDFLRRHGNDTAILLLWNKCDEAAAGESLEGRIPAEISARTGKGIAELIRAMTAALEAEGPAGGELREPGIAGPGIASPRQKELTDAAIRYLEEALSLADRGGHLELIAPLLRGAVDSLGEITGEVSTGDILAAMFGKFCVGK